MLTETRFINNSRSKHPFVDIGNQETRANFQQKILNCMVARARHIFQFFR